MPVTTEQLTAAINGVTQQATELATLVTSGRLAQLTALADAAAQSAAEAAQSAIDAANNSGNGGGTPTNPGSEPEDTPMSLAIKKLQAIVRNSPAILNGGVLTEMASGDKPVITRAANPNEFPAFANPVRYYISGNNSGTSRASLSDYVLGGTATGWSMVLGGGVTNNQNDGASSDYYYAKAASVASTWSPNATLGFWFDGRYLAIPSRQWAWQLIVDDKIFSLTAPAIAGNGNNDRLVTIDFGSRKMRKVILRGSADCWIACLHAQAQDTLIRLLPEEMGMRMNIVADSYGQDGSYAVGGLPYLQLIQTLLGGYAGRENAIGGTGWAKANNGDVNQYTPVVNAERLADMAAGSPDAGLYHVGLNDQYPTDSVSGRGTKASMITSMQNFRSANATAPIIALGPITPNEPLGQNATYTGMAAGLLDALQNGGITGPWVYINPGNGEIRNSSGFLHDEGGPWFTGTGYVGGANGSGNTDIYISGDQTHPEPPAGFRYLASRITRAAARGILALDPYAT